MIIPTDSELNKMSKEEYERLLEEIKRKGNDSNKVNNTTDTYQVNKDRAK